MIPVQKNVHDKFGHAGGNKVININPGSPPDYPDRGQLNGLFPSLYPDIIPD